mgnify:CR=1 FL=1
MFVDREEELGKLFKYLRLWEKGNLKGVLIYGLRRVGKTRLIEEFIKRAKYRGARLDASWISTPRDMLKLFSKKLMNAFDTEISVSREEDPIFQIEEALSLPEKIAKKLDERIIIAIDEFHSMLETIPVHLSKAGYGKADDIRERILWLIRDKIQSTDKVFWILSTSISFTLIKERSKDKKGRDVLLSTLNLLKVGPLKKSDAKKLAMALNSELSESNAELIAELTGGIPRLIEVIASELRGNKDILNKIHKMIEEGKLDEVFEAILNFMTDFSRRERILLIRVLKAVSEDNRTVKDVANYLGMDRQSAYLLLEELVRLDLLVKEKVNKIVKYEIRYPLMKYWLNLRVEPTKTMDIVFSTLGITAESYIRELFNHCIGREITIWDDSKGTFLAGTSEVIKLKIIRTLDLDEIRKYNADAGIVTEEGLILIEVKAKEKDITKEIVARICRREGKWFLIHLGTGEITKPAVAEAIKCGVVIITREGVKLIAKKTDFPIIP